jgi:hypothetical protein
MADSRRSCPDCQGESDFVDRRAFLKTAGVAAAAASATIAWPQWVGAAEASKAASKPETLVKSLYDSLKEEQRKEVCFDWNHTDKRGLLRTHVNNNWHITEPVINTDFFTKDQQQMIRQIFEGIYQPEWVKRIDKQLEDDAGGFGNDQNIAIFGTPGSGKFEFVMTGRHMTVRCDGDSTDHFAFGGPIFYGHAVQANELVGHPGNVFWPQALAANKVYEMLDEKQRKTALVSKLPREAAVQFQGADGKFPGIPVTELASDQKDELTKVLHKLIEPYRQSDRDEALACLKAQGGLDKCSLAFYSDGDIGGDKVWDCWRVEGPAFVWYFRGTPHVHVWANIADNPDVKVNTPAQLEYPA